MVTVTGETDASLWAAEAWQQWPTAHVPDGPLQRYRIAWVREYLDAAADADELPAFGSEEWAALSTNDPRKLASAVRAADAWRRELEDLPFTLAAEEYGRRAADEAHWRAVYTERRGIADSVLDRERVLARRAERDASADVPVPREEAA